MIPPVHEAKPSAGGSKRGVRVQRVVANREFRRNSQLGEQAGLERLGGTSETMGRKCIDSGGRKATVLNQSNRDWFFRGHPV